MIPNAICPINNKRIDEQVARTNAAFTVFLLTLFVISHQPLIVVFLLADFLLRSFEQVAYSPLSIGSKKLLAALSVTPKVINAGSKFFAAKIGAFFSLSILLSVATGLDALALVLTAVFGICAFLEAAVGFCLACKIYPYTFRLTHFSIYKSH
jgi:hypothetical protein